ncbi:outer membrane beta-barrel protein [Afipia sp. P52-10]|uniref:outer membrane beta-barrel protein n=1 Tax=Afipia sp. P52-10 TaxID=1429916 RepID=UPI0004B5D620|nr:outer membrane beta-barrel protein [Afipia sp. P52-10]
MSGWLEPGPPRGRRKRHRFGRALPAAILLAAAATSDAGAQALTSDLFNGQPDSFSGQNRPLRRIGDSAQQTAGMDTSTPSRIGQPPPVFAVPAGTGASSMGYDSLNRKKRPPRRKPAVSPTVLPPVPTTKPPAPLLPMVVPVVPPVRLPSAMTTANRPKLAPAILGAVEGQPPRRRLTVDDDPFGPAGIYAGTFLVKPAIEVWTGYDSNPGRINNGKGSWLYMIAPELLAASNWERHSVIADLRGSFTGYSMRNDGGCDCSTGTPVASPLPVNIDRPDFTGAVKGRWDVTRDTRINTDARLRVFTDNPGSPNIQANLQRYPIATSFGGTLGATQSFNRFEVTANGLVDRTVYQQSTLSDGTKSSNRDRDYNQYSGLLRGSYEVMPQLKPFVEATIDRRERDLEFDRYGYARNSSGYIVRAGSTFELSRLITGEASAGYSSRSYEDPRLRDISGFLVSASLIWKPTGLTTVSFNALTTIDETTLPGVSGVLSRSYSAQVEHAFRRYLIGTLKFGYTTADYDGSDRFDKIYSVGGDLVYKFTRDVHAKLQLRHDWLNSTATGADYQATLFMLGIRLQR